MEEKFTPRVILIFAGIVVLIIALVWQFYPSRKLEIVVFDVGQGDAILIKTPYKQQILIDGGPSDIVLSKLGENLRFFDRTLDIVILTHPHADHVTGLIEVLNRYKVKQVISTGALHTTAEHLEFLEVMKDKGTVLKLIDNPYSINLGPDLTLAFLYPTFSLKNQRIEDLNDASIVSKLIYKDKNFLFMGDATSVVEDYLLEESANLKADYLKIAHHGSRFATSQKFLNRVKPKMAIISVGENSFGHPSREVLNRLMKNGIKVLRTDIEADIKLTFDL